MNEKEKAEEIINKFWILQSHSKQVASAIIFVDEIIALIERLHKPEYTTFLNPQRDGYEELEYWKNVKSGLLKM